MSINKSLDTLQCVCVFVCLVDAGFVRRKTIIQGALHYKCQVIIIIIIIKRRLNTNTYISKRFCSGCYCCWFLEVLIVVVVVEF